MRPLLLLLLFPAVKRTRAGIYPSAPTNQPLHRHEDFAAKEWYCTNTPSFFYTTRALVEKAKTLCTTRLYRFYRYPRNSYIETPKQNLTLTNYSHLCSKIWHVYKLVTHTLQRCLLSIVKKERRKLLSTRRILVVGAWSRPPRKPGETTTSGGSLASTRRGTPCALGAF